MKNTSMNLSWGKCAVRARAHTHTDAADDSAIGVGGLCFCTLGKNQCQNHERCVRKRGTDRVAGNENERLRVG